MSDKAKLISGKSPEEVALDLLSAVAYSERKFVLGQNNQGTAEADRKYILDTYAECLQAVRAPNLRL